MSWPHPKFEPRILYLPVTKTWRCVVRRLPDGEFRSVEGAGPPPHLTPDAALAAAISRITDILAARQESLAVEVVRLLTSTPARLRPVNVPNPDPSAPTGSTLRYWEARGEPVNGNAGVWTSPQPTPYEAVRLALDRTNGDSQ